MRLETRAQSKYMNILYIGDIMAERGIETVEECLDGLKAKYAVDVVIAQAENVTSGRGITPTDMRRLQATGVDGFSGGNWSLHRPEIFGALSDPASPIVRPANYPDGTPGLRYKYVSCNAGQVLMVSLLGQIVGRDADKPVDNPLLIIDSILESQKDVAKIATVINFHGDFSSEKVIIGHYLDGRASIVVGDHWHVPTADARVLPGGTAHMSDVGMCGALDASLGVKFDSVIPRWRDGHQTRNIMESSGPRQFNALLVTVDPNTKLATHAQHIQRYL
jgi:metallophosphoesterase (TIGR00282 family)